MEVDECMSFQEVIKSLLLKNSNKAVMAIENSIAGSILPNYALIDENDINIIGEYYLPVEMNLMAVPGLADAEGLKALGVRRLSAGSSLSEAAFGLLRTRAGAFLQTGEAAGLGEGAMPYPEINGIMRTA